MVRAARPPAVPITRLLVAWTEGDESAFAELIPIVYKELRRLAQWHIGHERPGHTLQATALVNEAYLRLVEINQVRWQGRAHFFAMAARQMRRILIDAARKRGNVKHGGDVVKVTLVGDLNVPNRPEDLLALDEALDALAQLDARRGQVVEMKIFGGMSGAEIAGVLGVSEDTVKRDWTLAKAWLGKELRKR